MLDVAFSMYYNEPLQAEFGMSKKNKRALKQNIRNSVIAGTVGLGANEALRQYVGRKTGNSVPGKAEWKPSDAAKGMVRPIASESLKGATTGLAGGLAGYGAYRTVRSITSVGHRARRKVGLRRRRGTKG